MIYSVRTTEWVRDPKHFDGGYVQTDCRYRVRDASTVSDADVKAGIRPAITFEADTLDMVEAWLKEQQL